MCKWLIVKTIQKYKQVDNISPVKSHRVVIDLQKPKEHEFFKLYLN